MRIFGIVLVIIGLLMFAFNGINFKTEKTVVDAGPIEIKKKENNHVGWPAYAGGGVAIVGIILILAAGKTKNGI